MKDLNHNSDNNNYNLELFFEMSPDLLCIAGFDGYFKRINPAVSKLLEYTNEELYSRPINDFVFQDDKEITSKVRTELTKNTTLLNFENRYVTKKGEIVWLSWTSLPLESEQIIFAIAKNITHKKRQEFERNLLLTDLTKVNKDLKHLSYTTSHDLRSPVNSLLAVFSLLDTTKINDEQTIKFMEILKSSVQNLKSTLNNYVDVLKNKDSINTQLEDINLHESLNEVLQSINFLLKDTNAQIKIDFSEFEIIHFNKTFLQSIFLNLISNSIKYAKPNCHPDITIYTKNDNGKLQLIISDKGLGFDMEAVKDKIFGLHQKFNNHVDSKGIGLYLVYNHVTSLGGKIQVESKLNEGAKFIITFKS
jgi:PAS domain S-box-containing protein